MNKIGYIASVVAVVAVSTLACQKGESSGASGQTGTAATAATTPAPAKAADGKTGKQLMVGKWKLTKALMDGTDMTKEMGQGSVMTLTESSMTQKVGSSDVTTPFTVLKDSSSSVVIKDNKGAESTLTFADPTHLSVVTTDQGTKLAQSFERM